MKSRIVDHPHYWFWVIVEIWNGSQFIQGPAFRSIDQARAYLKGESGRAQEAKP